MPDLPKRISKDVSFDAHGRMIVSELFARSLRASLLENGRLLVHAPAGNMVEFWIEANRDCPPGGVGPDPTPNMCDCDLPLTRYDTVARPPVIPPDGVPESPTDGPDGPL